jgi:acyl-coenzyme A synthetase/AMP-(fatty) acid ligase
VTPPPDAIARLAAHWEECNDRPMSDFADMIFFHADASPDKPAVITGETVLTYRKLRQGILSAQRQLQRHGLKAGDRVAIHVMNAVGHVTLICALYRSGITSVSLEAMQTDLIDDLAVDAVLTNLPEVKGASRIVAVDESWFAEKAADEAIPNSALLRDEKAPCRLILSSGTTGKPKIISLSFDAVRERLYTYAIRASNPGWDRLLCMLGISTNFGFSFTVTALWLGRTICYPFEANPRQIILAHQIDLLVASTHQIASMVSYQEETFVKLDSLRAVHIGGAVAYAPLQARIRMLICGTLYCGYGSTEGGTVAYVPAESVYGMDRAVGVAVPWADIEVFDERKSAVPRGEEGEIRLRALGQGHRYRKNAAGQAEIDEAEWFYPGDRGVLYQNGLLAITGRVNEMINRGGTKVSPDEIEEGVKKYALVADAAAVGVLDDIGIEQIWLAVVTRNGAELEIKKIYDYCREQMPVFVPDRIFQVASIPRNQLGKVSRVPLTEQLKALEKNLAATHR